MNGQKFQCHTFLLSQNIKVLSQAVDDIINFKVYLRSTSEAMADREKWRCDGNTKRGF